MTQNDVDRLIVSLNEMMERIQSKEPILEQLQEIGRIQAEIANTAPAQLNHFLERRSYAKALEYLQHGVVIEDPNRPDCNEEEAHP
tara:strand:- start:75 stop:332 length:258 start_codon:yes stop_codon:yes gene_type:complete